jgi:hypothetical protein
MARYATRILLCIATLALADEPPPARFVEIGRSVGLSAMPAGRTQLIDVDGDGWLDLVVGAVPVHLPGAQRIYRSEASPLGGREFSDWTAASGLWRRPGGASQIASYFAWADLDGDGVLDALAIAHQDHKAYAESPQSHLVYRGLGNGRFDPVADSGVARDSHSTTMNAVLCDIDRDGRLDIVMASSYERYGESLVAQPLRALRNEGNARFVDHAERWGLLEHGDPGTPTAARPLFGVTAADLDRDGVPDLLCAAYGRQWNRAYLWDAQSAAYRDAAAELGLDGDAVRHGQYPEWLQPIWQQRYGAPRPNEAPFRSNGNTFALVPADVDGDGDLDVFSSEITHAWAGDSSDLSALLLSRFAQGERRFDRQIAALDQPDPATEWAWRPLLGLQRDIRPQQPRDWNQGDLQAHWADLDHDGRIDLIVCESDYPHNRLRVWLQVEPLRFVASEVALGIEWPNCPGLAIGDIDRDGALDLVTTGTRTRWPQARDRDRLALWRNQAARGGFVCMLLVGNGSTTNTHAIGARVTLEAGGQTQTRELMGPYGHWGAQQPPAELHFGTGTAEQVSLTIRWPDLQGSTTTIADIPSRCWVIVRQAAAGSETPAQVEVLRTFDATRWRIKPAIATVVPPK